MALPAALAGGAVASTGASATASTPISATTKLYVAIPGRDLPRVAAELATIMTANNTLADYHRARCTSLATE